MIDRVTVYQDDAEEWRWKRQSGGNNEVIADSGEGYRRRDVAMAAAMRANAGPYLFVLDSDTEIEIDTSGKVVRDSRHKP